MRKSLVISEQDNIAALLENDRVVEFFVNRGELLLGDIYTCTVENILPGIDAAFVNLGKDKMGFLHANDVPGQGPLKERLVPKQKLLVQITKEPTGHKGPRVSTAISLPGRFLVLVPEERGVSISRRISEARERSRLKSVVNLMKPPGVGLIIRTEAKGQGEQELFEDFEQLWDTWQTIVSEAEAAIRPLLIYRDQDLLYRVIRDAYSHEVTDIIVDSPDGQKRAQDFLQGWASKNTKVSFHTGDQPLLVAKNIDKEIESALTDRAELPSGGHLNIQPTEALTVIDVNSGKFTSSRTQAETVRRTNVEAAQEIPRQLRLRNIGGMVIVDFIDMESRKDQQQVLEVFQRVLEDDRAKPQVGQLSDLGLVELTRRRQGQSLRELFTIECTHCIGQGVRPVLDIGIQDGRRQSQSAQPEEEEPTAPTRSRGASGKGRGGSVLKSATASNGRVRSTVAPSEAEEAEEAEEESVPEEILAQMPEDILDDREDRRKRKRLEAFNAQDEEDEELEDSDESEDEEETREINRKFVAGRAALYEESLVEDEEPPLADELSQSISAVEEVYQEIGRSQAESEKVEGEVIAEEAEEDEAEDEEELAVGTAVADYLPEKSPFEAIESQFSGVFTLKTKPQGEEESGHANPAPAETLPSSAVETVPVVEQPGLASAAGESEESAIVVDSYTSSSEEPFTVTTDLSGHAEKEPESGSAVGAAHGGDQTLKFTSLFGANTADSQEQHSHSQEESRESLSSAGFASKPDEMANQEGAGASHESRESDRFDQLRIGAFTSESSFGEKSKGEGTESENESE